jgi:cell fate regulator YaaT (PSP1 superfamily)
MRTVNVEFKENGKQYVFFDNNLDINEGDYVIVETERGIQFGKAVSLSSDDHKEHYNVLKIANKNDFKKNQQNIKDSAKALEKAKELVNELGLEMKLIDCYFAFDRKQLVFQFLADNRIDFRELAKELAAIYKTRIELRQVGVRDKAKEISGLGACGRKLCCSSFLSDLDSVGISQVKNQNLALNPAKINGLCGRLLCCLKYENDNYNEYKKDLPDVGSKIKVDEGEGKVISVDVFKKKYRVLLNETNEIIEVDINNASKK